MQKITSFTLRLMQPRILPCLRWFSGETPNGVSNRISVNYVSREGKRINVSGQEGDDVMRLAQRNNIEIEGACEGSVACSTCHVYIDDSYYDKLETATEEEDDMLDMAPFLKPNSRLGCQIKLTKQLDGITVTLPPVTRNFYVDGHKPEPH